MKRSLQGLEMCRLLSCAGHSVTLSDMDKFKFSAARFSRSVDRWVSLPDVTPRSVLPYKVELRMSESSTVHNDPLCAGSPQRFDSKGEI